jgi:branched-chain amino acid transport system ATP-binding protein
MILEVRNLSKNFGGIKALSDCTLNIEKGKIIAIIGPNGSGKSTLFNVISRLYKEDSGDIYLRNENICRYDDFEVARKGVSRTFQDVRLFKNLTIREHLEIALSEDNEKIFAKQKDNDAKIKEILNLVGLDKPLDTYGSDLSYGQRKLLDLAIAIAKPHDILMLDEPVAGINPRLRREIKKILKKLNKKGESILLIEHDTNFVMDLADKVFVLDRGRVIAQGKPKEIQKNKKVLEAYLGE